MKNCEHYETLVSCWVDGELGRDERIEMLDHLVRCASCRSFYRQSRTLDGLVAGLRETTAPPRDGLWHGIERSVSRPRLQPRAWMGWAATIAVIAIGLGVAVKSGSVPGPVDQVVELRLGEDSGLMSEARFISLTSEMLRADRRYRSAMLQILDKVERDSSSVERQSEGPFQLAEGEENSSGARGPRVPA